MDAKEKEKLDRIIGAMESHTYSTLYQITGLDPQEDDEEYSKLISSLGRTIDSIDGGIEFIINHLDNSDLIDTLLNIISYTSKYDIMLQLIENNEKYDLHVCDLRYLYSGLARSPEHRHIVEELLMNKGKMKNGIIPSYFLVDIVSASKDSGLVKKILNNEELVDFIHWGNVLQDRKSDKLSFYPLETAIMIASTEDEEYIKKYATDKTLIAKMGYSEEEIAFLALASKDNEIIKKSINNRQNLRSETVEKLLLACEDKEILLEAMKCPLDYKLGTSTMCEIASKGFFSKETLKKLPLFNETKEGKMALELLVGEDPFSKMPIADIDAEIDIPEEMMLGIEIESVGRYAKAIKIRRTIGDWIAKEDFSLHGEEGESGVEVVSSILTGNNEKTTQSIKKITERLKAVGEYANYTCGAHVHFGANFLTSKEAFNNFRELWANNEKILFIISNREGEIPRKGIYDHSSPVSGEFEEQLSDTVQINNDEDLESFKKTIAKEQENRYKAVNFKNLEDGGKGTIEFRLSNGTVDAKTLIENINLYGGLIRAAQELSLIQQKTPSERTDAENEKLAIFDTLGTDKSLKEEKRLEYLLKLAIRDPKKREVYRRRYKINSELLRNNPEIEKKIDEKLSTNLIRYSDKKDIGKGVFTGKNAVNGEIMRAINFEINHDNSRMTEKGNNTI